MLWPQNDSEGLNPQIWGQGHSLLCLTWLQDPQGNPGWEWKNRRKIPFIHHIHSLQQPSPFLRSTSALPSSHPSLCRRLRNDFYQGDNSTWPSWLPRASWYRTRNWWILADSQTSFWKQRAWGCFYLYMKTSRSSFCNSRCFQFHGWRQAGRKLANDGTFTIKLMQFLKSRKIMYHKAKRQLPFCLSVSKYKDKNVLTPQLLFANWIEAEGGSQTRGNTNRKVQSVPRSLIPKTQIGSSVMGELGNDLSVM